jgi:hypothetical protein
MMKSTTEFIAAADKVRQEGGHFFTFDGQEYRITNKPDGSMAVAPLFPNGAEQWARRVLEAEAIRLAPLVRDGAIAQEQADAHLRQVEATLLGQSRPTGE